jgi:hypothetical protein
MACMLLLILHLENQEKRNNSDVSSYLDHREENNRIMQDFVIGFDNIENMLKPQDKRSNK